MVSTRYKSEPVHLFILIVAIVVASLMVIYAGATRQSDRQDPVAGDDAQPDLLWVEVTAEDWGEDWPFTVPRGHIACDGRRALFRSPDGTIWGLNGWGAMAYRPIDPIWRHDPDRRPQGRIYISPLLNTALSLCDD